MGVFGNIKEIIMFSLERAWNCNMRLKFAVKRAAAEGISKETVVKFWKDSARKLGYSGSYPITKLKGKFPTRNELIQKYTVHTGMFGSYAEWCGSSVSAVLVKHGYEPLSKDEQQKYLRK